MANRIEIDADKFNDACSALSNIGSISDLLFQLFAEGDPTALQKHTLINISLMLNGLAAEAQESLADASAVTA